MKRTIKIIIQLLLIALIGFVSQYVIRHVIYPTWINDDASLGIEKFDDLYALEDDTVDILFLGSSHSNLTFVPMVINEKTKADSYVLGAHGLPVFAMPYYLEEVLKTQKPKIVVVELFSVAGFVQYDKEKDDPFDDFHMYSDPMHLSLNKLKMIWDIVPKGYRLEHVFPIIAHHASVYSEKFIPRVKGFLNPAFDPNPFFGYELVNFSTNFVEGDPLYDTSTIKISDDFTISDTAYDYLDWIVELCKQNDIQLIFAATPMTNTKTSDVTDDVNRIHTLIDALSEYTKNNNIGVVNMFEYIDEIGVEKEDMLDDGHFNISGAKKTSSFFADYLNDNYADILAQCDWDYRKITEEKKVLFDEKMDWYKTQKTRAILEYQLDLNNTNGNMDTYFELINNESLAALYIVNKVDIDKINDPVKPKLLAMGWDERLLDGKNTFAVVANDRKTETFVNEDIETANTTASDMGMPYIAEITPDDTVKVRLMKGEEKHFVVDTNEILVIAYDPILKRLVTRTVINLDKANNPVYSIKDRKSGFQAAKHIDEINLEKAVKEIVSTDDAYKVRVTPKAFDAALAVIEVAAKCRYETIMTVSAGGIDTNVQLITGDNTVYAAVDLSEGTDFEISFDTVDNVDLQAIRMAGIE